MSAGDFALDAAAEAVSLADVSDAPLPSLTLTPIGFVRTAMRVKFQARHQPAESGGGERAGEANVLELCAGQGFEEAVSDLAGFDRVWLIWWFHRNTTWRPMVLPPRGTARRRGVFATRSPHRPNALGMTPVRLLAVERTRLILGDCDLVDGTPVFDIKPYVPGYDAFPEARAGWIDEVDAAVGQPPSFAVTWSALAREQVAWLRERWQVDFTARVSELLARDPSPHRTRRITKAPAGREGEGARIGCGAWRADFTVAGNVVEIRGVGPAYSPAQLARRHYTLIPDREAQEAFYAHWGER